MKKKNYSVTIKYLLDGNAETFDETITGATAETIVAQANMGHDLDFVTGEGSAHYIIPWSSVIALEAAYEMDDVLPVQDGICSETNSILVICMKNKVIPTGFDIPPAENFIDYIYDERGNEVISGYTVAASGLPADSNTPGEYEVDITVTVGDKTGSCETKLTITGE